MVYRFTIISDEVDNFRREIQIDSEATFLDLHNAILKSTGYPNDQMTSFFVCDSNWEKETEITLEDTFGDDEDFDLDELDPDGFEMGSAEDFENMLY